MSGTSQSDEYSESDHCKEVYAHFGLAYYESGVIESGIANALLYAEFLPAWKERIDREGKESFDRNIYEAEFDAFMKNQFAQTLGTLVRRLEGAVGIPPELRIAIAEGMKQRNILAHHYFRERATDFVNRVGRDRMIAELSDIGEKFREIDRSVQGLLAPFMSRLGIDDSMLQRFMDDFVQKAYAGEIV